MVGSFEDLRGFALTLFGHIVHVASSVALNAAWSMGLGGGALKQLLFILMPKSAMASSHSEMMRCVLSKSKGITIGGLAAARFPAVTARQGCL